MDKTPSWIEVMGSFATLARPGFATRAGCADLAGVFI